MFAFVDRSQMVAFSTTLAQPITLAPGMATAPNTPFQLAAYSGTNGNTGRPWAIADGTVLTFGSGGSEETVVVTVTPQGGNAPPIYSATFTKNHAAGVTVSARGNPGPWKNFDPRNNRTVVPYFSIID